MEMRPPPTRNQVAALQWCVDMAFQDHLSWETQERLSLARKALKIVREASDAWPDGRMGTTIQRTNIEAWQVKYLADRIADHGKRIDALEQRYDLERRQNEVARDWTEWHRVDPERAERWRREHAPSGD